MISLKKLVFKQSSSIQIIKKRLKSFKPSAIPFQKQDYEIIENIKERTKSRNLNNVTRTSAYLAFYQKHPEIEWAFLGHMVSRNGGWNMTDLRGGLLPQLLNEKDQKNFFLFLERGNYLIFHDIYPQLLLYEESKQIGQNLFYLLPAFDVSIFMQVIWNFFWEYEDRHLLAIALIINEQSYLETRVIQNKHFRKTVLDQLEFHLQELLHLNQILFPYEEQGEIYLLGKTVHHFSSLDERIQLGINLYEILFNKENLPLFKEWAKKHAHTGSRNDFWPTLFATINYLNPNLSYSPHIANCTIKSGFSKIFSPTLKDAWENIKHEPVNNEDWYPSFDAIKYLERKPDFSTEEIQQQYCSTLEKIETAIVAKQSFLL